VNWPLALGAVSVVGLMMAGYIWQTVRRPLPGDDGINQRMRRAIGAEAKDGVSHARLLDGDEESDE
jgi:hypothetical protein